MLKKHPLLFICVLPFRLLYKLILYLYTFCVFIKRGITNKIYKNDIDSMSGIEFESFAKKLLQQNGFERVELTPASNDYGIDLLAIKGNHLYAIQCKRYARTVGIEAVRQAATGCAFYEQDIPVVLTNNTFSSQAITLATALDVELWDRSTLQQMLKKTTLIKQRKRNIRLLFMFFILLLLYLFINI